MKRAQNTIEEVIEGAEVKERIEVKEVVEETEDIEMKKVTKE